MAFEPFLPDALDGHDVIKRILSAVVLKLRTIGGQTVPLHPLTLAASSAATNLAALTFNAIDDPKYRWMVDLRGRTKLRIVGRIGGSLTTATKIRVQYHLGGDPAVLTGDADWATLATTAGSHALDTLFYSAELDVPEAAQVNHLLIRAGLYGGNGVADPTLSGCLLNFYP